MAIYRPTYKDPKTGEVKQSKVWWINFTIAGKRVQESSKSTRKTLATEYEKRRRLELERALVGLPSEASTERIASVQEKVKTYLKHYPSNHRPKSVIFVTQRLVHVNRILGSTMLCDLSEGRIREYIKTRLTEGVAGRTVNMELGELSRAMGRTWRELWPKVRKLEERKDVGRALSPEEEKRLLDAAAANDSPNRNPMLYTILRIALSTGLRSGEILSLRWRQVDIKEGILTVGTAKTSSGTGRQVPMNDALRAALDLHASWYAKEVGVLRPEWFAFPGRDGKPKDGTARPLNPERPMESIKTAWATLRTASGVNCRIHDLRHTAATKMAEAGVPESTMLAIMGHMSRAMLERYSHIRMAAKREAVKSLSLAPVSNGPAKESAKVEHAGAVQ